MEVRAVVYIDGEWRTITKEIEDKEEWTEIIRGSLTRIDISSSYDIEN